MLNRAKTRKMHLYLIKMYFDIYVSKVNYVSFIDRRTVRGDPTALCNHYLIK